MTATTSSAEGLRDGPAAGISANALDPSLITSHPTTYGTNYVLCQDVTVTFPHSRTCGPVSFCVPQGESVLILGPSGSGKFTLLKAITGVIPHAINAQRTGGITVVDRDLTATEPHQNADILGVITQDPWTSVCLPVVEDDIAFSLENAGIAPALISQRVHEIAGQLNLSHLLKHPTTQLSGGELQRVALAAAIATKPPVLLLDEPTAMLDSVGVSYVFSALENSPTTRVLIEHRLDEIAALHADALPNYWVALDHDGSVLWQGKRTAIDRVLAVQLMQHGCWLPLDLELLALFGDNGGLDNPLVEQSLSRLVATGGSDLGVRDSGSCDSQSSVTPTVNISVNAAQKQPLSARNLSVAYPVYGKATGSRKSRSSKKPVLTDINIKINGGELVAVIGANGCGKTTLLRTLARVGKASSGIVEGPRAGMVFQNPEHQFMSHSVRGELAHNSAFANSDVVTAMLKKFDLLEVADLSPFSLSGGQKRRLSFAAMFMHERDFLLADEPTFGLDRFGTRAVMDAFSDLVSSGRGVLFSSHDLRTVATYASRVVVMDQGVLLADGSAWEIFTNHQMLELIGLRLPALVTELAHRTHSQEEFFQAMQKFHLAGVSL